MNVRDWERWTTRNVHGRLLLPFLLPDPGSRWTAPLHSVLPSPLPRCRLIPRAVRLVEVGNVGDKRVVGVGVCQH